MEQNLHVSLRQNIFAQKEQLFFVLQILLLILLCLAHALAAGHTCDFWPINGTFQNFNPARRLLAGQIPYRDFSDYLGLGHLYAGSIFTFLFGKNYQASLVAFSFLTILSFSMLSFFIGFSILRSKANALALTDIFVIVLFVQPPFYANGVLTGAFMRNALNAALGVGNSCRFVRGMILPIFILLFLIGEKYISKFLESRAEFKKYEAYIYSASFGLLAGFSFLWSNDYGISAFVCSFAGFLWCALCKWRKAKKVFLFFGIFAFSALLGAFLFGEIFTLGHFHLWLKNTFGVGDFQRWYYVSGASSYVFEIDLSFLTVLQLLICFCYAYFIFANKADRKSLTRFGIPCFCNLASYCAVNEYKLLSGGSLYEVAYSVLFLTLFFEFLSAASKIAQFSKIKSVVALISVLPCLAWLIPNCLSELMVKMHGQNENSIPELGGGWYIFV